MRPFYPSQTALVLGGGGAKGAYEIGAIAALEDMGIHARFVYGTSIGALNAAMYAQGDMDQADELWERLRLSDLVTPESLQLADDAEALFDHPEKLLEFISRNAQKKGVNIAPLRELMHAYIDEAKLRRSGVRFGLVATRFPSMAMVQKQLEDMEEGSLIPWLLASCACFPVFPMTRIGEERYMDGGFCDNVPVDMAIESGAQHIIAIDIGRNLSHPQYRLRPNVTYIRASHPLGGLLAFDPQLSRRNRTLGYNDTLRAFGRLRGTHYSFDAHDARLQHNRACRYLAELTQLESRLHSDHALTRRDEAPLFALLEANLRPGADAVDYFLRACELCAEIAQANPAQVFTLETFSSELRTLLPFAKAESLLDSLLGGRIGVLFSPPQPDRRLVIACLYHLLQRESTFSPLTLRTLCRFPREMLCALTLREIL
ncbi:MAG: patatin-like phospholipase family protein [Clostridia bacterium]|nr:patatin-like phospholipase family protein [Clostridia bacterium]